MPIVANGPHGAFDVHPAAHGKSHPSAGKGLAGGPGVSGDVMSPMVIPAISLAPPHSSPAVAAHDRPLPRMLR